MEQWNNMLDIEDNNVPIDVYTDFPDNVNTFVYANLIDGVNLDIDIATNKKFKIDVYLSNDAYACVHKTNINDIHFFINKNEILQEEDDEEDEEDEDDEYKVS